MNPTDTRAERRLRELERALYQHVHPLEWTVSTRWPGRVARPPAVAPLTDETYTEPGAASACEASGGARVTLPKGIARTFWASAHVEVPASLAGLPLVLLLETRTEGMVYVDGEAWQGLDRNRPELRLSEAATPGAAYEVDVMLFTTRDQEQHGLRGRLAVRDVAIEAYRHDLRTLLGVARTLPAQHPTALHLWRIIAQSLDAIDFHTDYARPSVKAAAETLKEGTEWLRSSGHAPEPAEVFLAGNSHIDVVWLWTLAETRQKMGRTTATALRYMDELPDYRFGQSQAQLYAYLREDFPKLFERVQERVEDGRWEILGGAWVEPDCNITGGESLVRQLLYGQQFWREHFEFESDLMWLPDTFGYASAMPQILQKSGIDTFVTQKLTWSETNQLPHGHFEWEGIDGSRIRCIFPQVYVARTYPEEIRRFYDRYPSKEVSTSFLFLYGYGDGGGGPVREDVELGRRLADAPGFPRCRLSRVDEAIEAIRADADATAERYGQPLPVWKGELYLEFHRGTLTTHAEVKRRNRHGELLLRAAEIRSSLACLMGKSAYPAPELKAAWKSLLLNQFHDILPGTSIPEAYPEVHATYTEIEQLGGALLDAACEAVTEADEGAITVFNEHGWDVVDYVEAEVPAHSRPFRLVNSDGEEVAYQFVADQPGVIGFEAAVPALGTATYRLESGEPMDVEPLSASEEMIETGRYRIEINAAGELVSVYDLDLEREWLRAPANVLQTFEDRPNNWEAWDVNDWYETKPLELLSCVSRSVVEQGPVRVVVRLRFETPAGSTLQQDIVVYRSVPRIDFPMVLDWHEQRVLLKAAYPVDVHAPSATYEIQFGAIERPTSRNTSWEQAKFEVCGHKWIDLSEAGGGVSLLNTGKYGHDVRDHVLRTTLLRTPTHPDPRAPHPPFMFLDDPNVFTDQGEHRTTLALYPHAGRWSEADTVRQAFQLNAPLRAVVGQSGTEQVAVSVEPAGAILESLKQAEDGDGWILRVYEAHGGSCDIEITLPVEPARVSACDLMERPSDEALRAEGRCIHAVLKPYEIRSFRVEFE